MDKNVKRVLFLVTVYLLIFWVGYRSGEIACRIKKAKEIIMMPAQAQSFFVVERHADGDVTFSEVNRADVIIRFLYDDKLKPLLKLRDVQIYDANGQRVY